MNFHIVSQSFARILRIIFDFQNFLAQKLFHNSYIIKLIPLEFLG